MTAQEPGAASVAVRAATVDDVPLILTMIRELAAFERSLHEVRATEELLREHLFAEQPAVFCHIAEVDGEPLGFALWFINFSTWTGKHGIYLDDLYVRPEARGRGIGTALLRELAGICPRPWLRPARLVGARLEPEGDRLLPLDRCDRDGRVDGAAPHR